MRILVLNGSPKGSYSITLQTVNYLQAKYPTHEFDVLHVGQRIKQLEKDFVPAQEALEKADLLLFSYPVYTFIAPSQLHRFIEGKFRIDAAVDPQLHFVKQGLVLQHGGMSHENLRLLLAHLMASQLLQLLQLRERLLAGRLKAVKLRLTVRYGNAFGHKSALSSQRDNNALRHTGRCSDAFPDFHTFTLLGFQNKTTMSL